MESQKTLKWPQFAAGLSAAGGAFIVGVALGWPSPAGPRLVNNDKDYFEIDKTLFDWAASIITIGCAISCLPIGFLMQKFGRKWTMLAMAIPFVIGWGYITFAPTFSMIFFGRILLGVAGGAFCVSAPQYAAEISEKEIRGTVGSFCVLLINAGILFVYIIGATMTVFWMNVVCMILPAVFGFIFFFMPESPVFLVAQNRDEEAIKAYKWLRGEHYDPQDEMEELKRELEEIQAENVPFREVLRRKGAQKALFIGFGLMFFQQFSGINVVIFYSKNIFMVRQA
jgi:MFS family permease